MQMQRDLQELEIVVLKREKNWHEYIVGILNKRYKFTRAKANGFIVSTILKNSMFGFEDGLYDHHESNVGVNWKSMIVGSNVELSFELQGRPTFKWFGKDFKIVMNKLDGVDFKLNLLTEAPLLDHLYEEREYRLILEGEFRVADLSTNQKKEGIKGVMVMGFKSNKSMLNDLNHSIWGKWGISFLSAVRSLLLIFNKKLDQEFKVRPIRRRRTRR